VAGGISRDGEMGAIMRTNSEARCYRVCHLPFANSMCECLGGGPMLGCFFFPSKLQG
jgi:hypothetical protein